MNRVVILALMVAFFPATLIVLFLAGQQAVIRDILWLYGFATVAGTFAVVTLYRDLRKRG